MTMALSLLSKLRTITRDVSYLGFRLNLEIERGIMVEVVIGKVNLTGLYQLGFDLDMQ